MRIPDSLTFEFNKLELAWKNYKNYVIEEIQNNQNQEVFMNSELLFFKSEFIDAADELTTKLGNFSQHEKNNLYSVQISLLVVNVFSHLFLIYFIIRLITKAERMKHKKEKLEKKNNSLVDELHNLIIKNNSIQLMSSLLLHELQEAEKLANKLEFVSEEDKMKYFWKRFYENLKIKLEELENSKKKYEAEKSYYEQLNKRFKNGMYLLSEKNRSSAIKNHSDDNALDDLRDLINSMSEAGKISPKNNRILTDVLNSIVDMKLKQKGISHKHS